MGTMESGREALDCSIQTATQELGRHVVLYCSKSEETYVEPSPVPSGMFDFTGQHVEYSSRVIRAIAPHAPELVDAAIFMGLRQQLPHPMRGGAHIRPHQKRLGRARGYDVALMAPYPELFRGRSVAAFAHLLDSADFMHDDNFRQVDSQGNSFPRFFRYVAHSAQTPMDIVKVTVDDLLHIWKVDEPFKEFLPFR